MRSSRPSSARPSAHHGLGIVVTSLVAVVIALGACTSAATPAATLAATLDVSGAWVRAAATTGGPTAAYLVIANTGGQADALLGVTSPAAATVEMHETSTDMGGMTGMQPVARIVVPAGGSVRLEPGGFHLMVTGLKAPLTAGGTVELDLRFEHAGSVVVQADIRAG